MPAFLIKVTWGKWQTDLPWLTPGDLPASALFDLRFPNNKLSVWKIDDTASNLNRILAALAANKNKKNLERVEYVLLDPAIFTELSISMDKSEGDTPDKEANREWHFDLIELTDSKIVSLARKIKSHGQFQKKAEAEIKQLVSSSVTQGHIDIGLIKADMRPAIERLKLEAKKG